MSNNDEQLKVINDLTAKLNKSYSKGMALREELDNIKNLPSHIKERRAIASYFMEEARRMIASKAFPRMTPEQAYVVIMTGEEMDLSPVQSLNDLYIVNGQIGFHSKGLVNRVVSKGYDITYSDESKDGVTVTISKDGKEWREIVRASEPVLQRSNAMKFAPLEKMRYHGIRRIVKFHLAFLVSSVSVTDPEDVVGQTVDIVHEEVNEKPSIEIDSPEYVNMINAILNGDVDLTDVQTIYTVSDKVMQAALKEIQSNQVDG